MKPVIFLWAIILEQDVKSHLGFFVTFALVYQTKFCSFPFTSLCNAANLSSACIYYTGGCMFSLLFSLSHSCRYLGSVSKVPTVVSDVGRFMKFLYLGSKEKKIHRLFLVRVLILIELAQCPGNCQYGSIRRGLTHDWLLLCFDTLPVAVNVSGYVLVCWEIWNLRFLMIITFYATTGKISMESCGSSSLCIMTDIILLPSGTQYVFSDVLHMKVTITEVRILCEWCLICSTDHFQPLYQKF